MVLFYLIIRIGVHYNKFLCGSCLNDHATDTYVFSHQRYIDNMENILSMMLLRVLNKYLTLCQYLATRVDNMNIAGKRRKHGWTN